MTMSEKHFWQDLRNSVVGTSAWKWVEFYRRCGCSKEASWILPCPIPLHALTSNKFQILHGSQSIETFSFRPCVKVWGWRNGKRKIQFWKMSNNSKSILGDGIFAQQNKMPRKNSVDICRLIQIATIQNNNIPTLSRLPFVCFSFQNLNVAWKWVQRWWDIEKVRSSVTLCLRPPCLFSSQETYRCFFELASNKSKYENLS